MSPMDSAPKQRQAQSMCFAGGKFRQEGTINQQLRREKAPAPRAAAPTLCCHGIPGGGCEVPPSASGHTGTKGQLPKDCGNRTESVAQGFESRQTV